MTKEHIYVRDPNPSVDLPIRLKYEYYASFILFCYAFLLLLFFASNKIYRILIIFSLQQTFRVRTLIKSLYGGSKICTDVVPLTRHYSSKGTSQGCSFSTRLPSFMISCSIFCQACKQKLTLHQILILDKKYHIFSAL